MRKVFLISILFLSFGIANAQSDDCCPLGQDCSGKVTPDGGWCEYVKSMRELGETPSAYAICMCEKAGQSDQRQAEKQAENQRLMDLFNEVSKLRADASELCFNEQFDEAIQKYELSLSKAKALPNKEHLAKRKAQSIDYSEKGLKSCRESRERFSNKSNERTLTLTGSNTGNSDRYSSRNNDDDDTYTTSSNKRKYNANDAWNNSYEKKQGEAVIGALNAADNKLHSEFDKIYAQQKKESDLRNQQYERDKLARLDKVQREKEQKNLRVRIRRERERIASPYESGVKRFKNALDRYTNIYSINKSEEENIHLLPIFIKSEVTDFSVKRGYTSHGEWLEIDWESDEYPHLNVIYGDEVLLPINNKSRQDIGKLFYHFRKNFSKPKGYELKFIKVSEFENPRDVLFRIVSESQHNGNIHLRHQNSNSQQAVNQYINYMKTVVSANLSISAKLEPKIRADLEEYLSYTSGEMYNWERTSLTNYTQYEKTIIFMDTYTGHYFAYIIPIPDFVKKLDKKDINYSISSSLDNSWYVTLKKKYGMKKFKFKQDGHDYALNIDGSNEILLKSATTTFERTLFYLIDGNKENHADFDIPSSFRKNLQNPFVETGEIIKEIEYDYITDKELLQKLIRLGFKDISARKRANPTGLVIKLKPKNLKMFYTWKTISYTRGKEVKGEFTSGGSKYTGGYFYCRPNRIAKSGYGLVQMKPQHKDIDFLSTIKSSKSSFTINPSGENSFYSMIYNSASKVKERQGQHPSLFSIIDEIISSFPNYYSGGQLKTKKGYSWIGKTVKQGTWITYYQNGNKKTDGYYSLGRKSGEWKYFYENGQLEYIKHWNSKDNLDGLLKYYDEDGHLKHQGNYTDGKRTGIWGFYYQNEELRFTLNYLDGKATGEYISYFKNRVIQSKGNYRDNSPEGKSEAFYESGKLKHTGSYTDGKRNGVWKYFYENGQLIMQGSWINGLATGSWNLYHDNGQLFQTRIWDNGKLMNIEACFGSNGSKLDTGSLSNGTGTLNEYDKYGTKINELEFANGEFVKGVLVFGEWNNYNVLNSNAWKVYEGKIQAELNFAIQWIERSLELNKNYANTDTYAALLFKKGDYTKALLIADKAIKLAMEAKQNYSTTEELIKQIKAKQ